MSRAHLVRVVSLIVIVASPAAYFATKSFATKSQDPPVALSPKQTTSEYRSEARSLKLAPGWAWPATPVPAVAPDGRGIVYEPGWGRQAADHYWYCSWTSLAVDPRVGATARRQALENALAIRRTYYFTTALAAVSRPAFAQVLRDAERGDVRGLRRDYELNCPETGAGGGSR